MLRNPSGLLALVSIGVVYFLYLHYPELGIAHASHALRTVGIVIGASLLVFLGLRWLRARQGIDLIRVAKEIPPE